MALELRIIVQVDRLPNVDAKDDNTGMVKVLCQLGLRISATIIPDPAIPTPQNAAALIQPWLWRSNMGDANGTWKAHEKGNWTVWRLKKGQQKPDLIQPNFWQMAVLDPVAFDPNAGDKLFHARI